MKTTTPIQTRHNRHRWFVVGVFFVFMLLHQADKLLIGPLTTQIMETFKITRLQMGAVSTGALLVGAFFYPLWGYLYDRYARAKLLALASFLWGITTWMNAWAPTYSFFLVTRSSTGIDDASYPGLFSMISDYFEPKLRGKIYGLLQLTGPIGYLLGMILGLMLAGAWGWRGIFYLTGSLGILLSVVIFFSVKDAPRGQAEPEMGQLAEQAKFRFEWSKARALFRKPAIILLVIQGFFGVFPWNAITYWFFNYLETERGYTPNETLITMAVSVLVLAAGYPLGGALGDALFRHTPRGRAYVALTGVVLGALFFWLTLTLPHDQKGLFLVGMSLTALFMPFAAPNVISIVYDVSVPEVRSTAHAIENFIESGGAALSPLLVGWISSSISLEQTFLWLCISTWAVCAVVLSFVAFLLPKEVAALRAEMNRRAQSLTKTEG